jgi:hypothetical protein
MNWLRNNDPNPADVDDPSSGAGEPGLPMPGRLSPEEKARVVEDSVNWLRNNECEARGRQRAHLTALTNLSTNAEGFRTRRKEEGH